MQGRDASPLSSETPAQKWTVPASRRVGRCIYTRGRAQGVECDRIEMRENADIDVDAVNIFQGGLDEPLVGGDVVLHPNDLVAAFSQCKNKRLGDNLSGHHRWMKVNGNLFHIFDPELKNHAQGAARPFCR